MPNVMGREFPYTPQGMAAAQQYRQALGMRDGGPMGFRPVGMQAGGVPGVNPLVATGMGARAAGAGADARNANTEIYLRLKEALALSPAELNIFLYENTGALKSMADDNPARAEQLADAMKRSGFERFMRNLMQGADQVSPMQVSPMQVPPMQVPPMQVPPMQVPPMQVLSPRGMEDFSGYEPETGDFYPPEQEEQTPIPGPIPGPMNRGGFMSLRRR